ncbi:MULTISPECIES: glycoside hydrolase family 2 protein [unclassified Fusibacter]|uniref:glycoside hydrolase family 2 protein n=1 Tax=unclassified Fusibacter TaxID=2624464 RepID=UPI0010119620|nr:MULTISPECIES: glycoside hydrolase family 2 TIM barrel-domain containing protein [unclassified Fusibacter]MCK8061626.1 hypothetical protein [Fusibacter sp. A2]NPE23809.1 hypothetical protein [Fusibacter sp. A1]RXV58647.1 hypothetical protein DWB64_18655 [Fusibacter sp. A1]
MLEWSVGYSEIDGAKPKEFVSSTVPGAVQLDWAKAKGYKPYIVADNYKQFTWMEDVYWIYKTTINKPEINDDERIYFISKGIDYKFRILIDDEVVHRQEGMFKWVEIDITEKIKTQSEIQIIIDPVPKQEGAVGRDHADQSCKPAVSYGWDWHPPLIPSGIWDETYIEIRSKYHLRETDLTYVISEDLKTANCTLKLNSKEAGQSILFLMKDAEGKVVHEKQINKLDKQLTYEFKVSSPMLWWPRGQGEQYLYTYQIQVFFNDQCVDMKDGRIGFRRARLVMHEGAWHEFIPFPKGRNNPPITMEINNRHIFSKGTNWVNPDIFPGVITKETYRTLIQLAVDANMNMFRIWGGGIVNKESFFDLCDEMGMMVWEEFPLACNNYRGNEPYLKVLDQESKAIIKRLKKHASVVMWCGGNELFNNWSGMTEQSLALRLLDKNCYEFDRDTPFIMTSPIMGMAHGNYVFQYDDGRSIHEVMTSSSNTAYTEFGCPSISDYDYLETFIPKDELETPAPGGSWEIHHAYNAWQGDTWMSRGIIEHYYGKTDDVKLLIENSQLLQSEGYKVIFEEARRQKPKCSMALNWCYNEPWPSAANNSLINWPARPKKSLKAVADSLRDTMASARVSKYIWTGEEVFEAQLFMLNDSPEIIAEGKMSIYLVIDDEKHHMLTWDYKSVPENQNLEGPTARLILPNKHVDRMSVQVEVEGIPAYASSYTFAYRFKEPNLEGLRQLNN